MNTLITIGISCYNIAPYLPRAIDSVRAQTYANLEILIVDDGSTDGSGAVCDEYAQKDDRIRVIHKENEGLGSTRNVVLEEARGTYIAFLDGDDYVEPDMYETMLQAMREADVPLAICRYVEECESAGVSVPVPHDAPSVVQTLPRDTLLTLYIEEDDRTPIRNAAWNKLYRADLIRQFRYPEHKLYEDMVVTTQVIAACDKAVFVDRPLYHYIIDRGGSIMNRGVNPRIITDQIPAYKEKSAFLRLIGRDDLADTHDYLVYKKLLALYTQTFRQRDGASLRRQLRSEIETCRERMEQIYTCRIADPHQKLRMQLFLTHPALYNVFTAVNDNVIHRIRGIA